MYNIFILTKKIYILYERLKMSTAIIITGTICSGKTTISKKISEYLDIKFLSEENVSPKGLMSILREIRSGKFTDIVLIEHANILNFIDDITDCFDKLIIILLNTSDTVLADNINMRKQNNIIGDYLNIDIFESKKEIQKQFETLKYDKIIYVADITKNNDYGIEFKNIIEFLSLHI